MKILPEVVGIHELAHAYLLIEAGAGHCITRVEIADDHGVTRYDPFEPSTPEQAHHVLAMYPAGDLATERWGLENDIQVPFTGAMDYVAFNLHVQQFEGEWAIDIDAAEALASTVLDRRWGQMMERVPALVSQGWLSGGDL